MKNDWEWEKLAEAWGEANGSGEYPYGDFWRMALINPIIFEMLEYISEAITKNKPFARDWDAAPSLFSGLAKRNKELENIHSHEKYCLIDWHKGWFSRTSLPSPINILDFGCGEACIGRHLGLYGLADYIGLDSSKHIIELAQKRKNELFQSGTPLTKRHGTTQQIEPNFFQANLEVKKDLESVIKQIPKEWYPHLTLCVCIFEHMGKIETSLSVLKELMLRNKGNSIALFVTVNYNYYIDELMENKEDDHERFHQKNEAVIETVIESLNNSDLRVKTVIRTVKRWKEIFRNSRFRILDNAPLRFSLKSGNDLMDKNKKGVAPFEAYILTPFVGGRAIGKDELSSILDDIVERNFCKPLSQLNKKQVDLLKKHRDELEVIEANRGDYLVGRFDHGGDLFLMLSGAAILGDGELSFSAGELFGDLELSMTEREIDYIHPITVCSQECKVLRIPSPVANRVLSVGGLGRQLFGALRDRVVIWNYNMPGVEEQHNSDFKLNYTGRLPGQKIIAIARKFLSAVEAERQFVKRSPSGRFIYFSDEEIANFIKSNSTGDMWNAIRVFASLGIVDSISGNRIWGDKKFRLELFRESFRFYFHELISEEDLTSAENKLFAIDEMEESNYVLIKRFSKNELPKEGAWNPKFKRVVQDIETIFSKTIEENTDFEEALLGWFGFLWRLGCSLSLDFPSFFVVQDQDLLKKMIYCRSKELNQIFDDRCKALYSTKEKGIPSEQFLWREMEDNYTGTYRNYISCYKAFILNDLYGNSGKMTFSGKEYGYEKYIGPELIKIGYYHIDILNNIVKRRF